MSNFYEKYISDYQSLFKEIDIGQLIKLQKKIEIIKTTNNKVICQGNGGSAAIASHFAIDLSKNAKVKATNFNESSLITCLANDYGYENWLKEALKINYDRGDLIILISSSGESKNILNACSYCLKENLEVITFTGMSKNNSLKSLNSNGINIHVDSKAYNYIENVHQLILLGIVDAIIGKAEYKAS